jgi:tetratricopeptide (TPR) repeat protein
MLGTTLGPYQVLSRLGAGGMGEVYLAYDARLDRRVALKSPSDAWLADPEAHPRLQREARAAARLTHPNIAAVYDVFEADGRPFIVMEYVEGESLAALLARGRLPLERALAIGASLCEALSAAHAAGVVHRDLKPGNLMITPSGGLKVLDFGLAKSPGGDTLTTITTPGRVLGTPGFVAPEQLLGRPATARSDVYSAGAILFELIGGRTPWEGVDVESVSLLSPPPRLDAVTSDVPHDLADVVARALEPDPARRCESAARLATDLRHVQERIQTKTTVAVTVPRPNAKRTRWRDPRILTAAAVVAALAIGIPIWRQRHVSPSVTTIVAGAAPVVAVLPLDILSGDPNIQYLGAGLADTLRTKLAGVHGLAVVSRTEIADAQKRQTDPASLMRALGATWLITGGVQETADRIQISVNLLTGDARTIAAGEVFEDMTANIFALQERIAERLAARMLGSVSDEDRAQLSASPTTNVQALADYYRGRKLLEMPGGQHVDEAIAAFKAAVAADDHYAEGVAGLAEAYWSKYLETRDAAFARTAVEEAQRASRMAPQQTEVRYALATIYQGSGRAEDATVELKAVLDQQPTNEDAQRTLGDVYRSQGRRDDAIAQYRKALTVRPDYWVTYRSIAQAQLDAGRYDEARAAAQKITELQPQSPIGYQVVGTIDAAKGDLPAATRNFEESIKRGGSPATYSTLGTVYYLQGRFADAAIAYREAIARRPNNALTHRNLGDALRQLHRADEARGAYADAVRLYDADLTVNPTDAVAIATRATCRARAGQLSEALADSERAARLAPDNPDVLYERTLVLLAAGRRGEALQSAVRAAAAGYSLELLKGDADVAPLTHDPRFQTLTREPAASRRGR